MKRIIDPEIRKKQFTEVSQPGETHGALINHSLKVITNHPKFPQISLANYILFAIDVIPKLSSNITKTISRGAVFTMTDLITMMCMSTNDEKRRPGVSAYISVSYYNQNLPVINSRMYILAKTEGFYGSYGFSRCYFYDENLIWFAEGYQIAYYFDVSLSDS